MKSHCRKMLSRLGSEKASKLGWRDMWAMVTRKGDLNLKVPFKAYAEEISKSNEFHSWGPPVSIHVDIPLITIAESQCRWEDSAENERRQTFCNRVEGYGSVCSCRDPAPLTFPKTPTSVSIKFCKI